MPGNLTQTEGSAKSVSNTVSNQGSSKKSIQKLANRKRYPSRNYDRGRDKSKFASTAAPRELKVKKKKIEKLREENQMRMKWKE